jgi:GxxExxY protein
VPDDSSGIACAKLFSEPGQFLSVSVCVGLWLMSKMELNEITYRINGAVYEVNKVLGAGFLEKVYENALLIELRQRGLNAESQVPVQVHYKGDIVGDYYVDILVENQVLVELKAVEQLQKVHEAQLLNYLKAAEFSVGLLINFKHPKAEIKRFIV